MSREARVRFWERVGVRLPCATRQVVTDTLGLLVGAESTPLMCKIAVVPGSSSVPSTICFLGCVICLPTAPNLATSCRLIYGCGCSIFTGTIECRLGTRAVS